MSVRCQEAGGRKRARDCLDEKRRRAVTLLIKIHERLNDMMMMPIKMKFDNEYELIMTKTTMVMIIMMN